jgi:hypothetical protein
VRYDKLWSFRYGVLCVAILGLGVLSLFLRGAWFLLFIGALILVALSGAIDGIRDERRHEAEGSGVDPRSRLPGNGPNS